MKSIVYIVSGIDKALAFEWISNAINHSKYRLSFILLNKSDSFLECFLKSKKIQVFRVYCHGKKSGIYALWRTYRILRNIKPEIVHCHLWEANIIGLTAAKLAGVKKRIYTRHHSDYHHVYHPQGLKWDMLANRMATKIVSISEIVTSILIRNEKVVEKKIVHIPHGFCIDYFEKVELERIESFRKKHQIFGQWPIIGINARFTKLKGIQYCIPAVQQILEKWPDTLLLLMGASGDYENEIFQLLHSLPEKSYRTVVFEFDIAAAYKCMTIYLHTPISESAEAFGQTYIEALISGVPSIFTISGIAREFISDGYNALVVPHCDSQAIFTAIERLLTQKLVSETLTLNGKQSAKKLFPLEQMIKKLELLYDE